MCESVPYVFHLFDLAVKEDGFDVACVGIAGIQCRGFDLTLGHCAHDAKMPEGTARMALTLNPIGLFR